MSLPYDSPRELSELLARRGLSLKKRFGQNFLVSPGARQRIVDALELEDDMLVWEIGPGLGVMTGMLLDRGVRLRAFEIDHGFVRVLEEEFAERPRLRVVPGDVLDTWKQVAEEEGTPDRVMGNLPYSSASAIIAKFTEAAFLPPLQVYTVQKEMALRMSASPGSKDYSSFSVLCRTFLDPELVGDLKAGSFFPAPEVTSTIVRLRPRSGTEAIRDRKLLLVLIPSLFASRRKTIWNNLIASPLSVRCGKELLRAALDAEGIPPGVRGETLPPERITALADRIARLAEGEAGSGEVGTA